MSATTYTSSCVAGVQQRKAGTASLMAGLDKISRKAKDLDVAIGARVERLLKRLSPPGSVSLWSKKATAEPDHTDSAELLAKMQNRNSGAQGIDSRPHTIAVEPATQSSGTTKPFQGKGRARDQDFEDFGPVPRPAPQALYGRSVSVVDTSACVDLMREDPQSLRGGLQRTNAIRRKEAPEWLRNITERAERQGQPIFDWIRDALELRSGPVGVELLPPHPDTLALLRRNPKQQPEEVTEHYGMLPPMELYAIGVLGGDERSACRAMPTMDEDSLPWTSGSHEADSTPRSARSNDDNVPLLLLRPMMGGRRNSAHRLDQSASVASPNDSIGRRLVGGPSHIVQIHRSGGIHSQAAVICEGDDFAD